MDPDDNTTWAAVNLTGSTVRFRIREVGSTSVLNAITATVTSAANGQVTVAFPNGTWTTSGTFEGEIEHTTSGGGIQTVQDLLSSKCGMTLINGTSSNSIEIIIYAVVDTDSLSQLPYFKT